MEQVINIPIAEPSRPISAEALEGDLIQVGHALFGIIWINAERMGGAPCFAGTRVPIQTLFDHMRSGESLDDFLDGFEGVTREQGHAVIEMFAACNDLQTG